MRAVAPGSQDAGRRAHTEKQSHVKRDASCRKPEHREWQKRASGEREAGNAEWPEEGRGGKPPGRGRAVCLREVMTLKAGKAEAAGLLWELGGRSSGPGERVCLQKGWSRFEGSKSLARRLRKTGQETAPRAGRQPLKPS